jgi:two-component SAPR family response regulator
MAYPLADTYMGLANIYHCSHRFQEARQLYQNALQLNPLSVQCYRDMALCLRDMGDMNVGFGWRVIYKLLGQGCSVVGASK